MFSTRVPQWTGPKTQVELNDSKTAVLRSTVRTLSSGRGGREGKRWNEIKAEEGYRGTQERRHTGWPRGFETKNTIFAF